MASRLNHPHPAGEVRNKDRVTPVRTAGLHRQDCSADELLDARRDLGALALRFDEQGMALPRRDEVNPAADVGVEHIWVA